ncbi:SPOR domain-containing protein [Pseudoalteromonas rhizosphaerae]|uniref:SPOR domain-containing protein n=1 Tax=Pseudoalteromonas rhizosphaerae TaxID=2518973 RepID=A0ABW8L2B2_9GAMM
MEQQSALISDQQVKEYVQQWHSQQESITRLAAMEEDLQLLIMALSSQTDIAENPAVLREDNVTVAHYDEKIQTPDTANSSKTIENRPFPLYDNSLPGAQLGLYLKPQRVRTQIARLQQQYPQAFSQLDFVMTERHNKGVTLYGLRVGPFQNYTEANLFCSLAQNLGQKCLSAPFVGQPL